jgi:hypothetical protein
MDERLRELERRWKQTGAVADEAACLQERLRLGELERDRLDLAAHAGYEGALLAGGAPAPDPALAARLRGLERWGHPVLVRGCLAITAAAIPQAPAGPIREACDSLQSAAESWLQEGSFETWQRVFTAMTAAEGSYPQALRAQMRRSVNTVLEGMLESLRAGTPAPEALGGAAEAGLEAIERFSRQAFEGFRTLQTTSGESLLLVAQWVAKVLLETDPAERPRGQPDPVEMVAHFVSRLEGGASAAEAALASEIGAWALGYGDPVQERAAAR